MYYSQRNCPLLFRHYEPLSFKSKYVYPTLEIPASLASMIAGRDCNLYFCSQLIKSFSNMHCISNHHNLASSNASDQNYQFHVSRVLLVMTKPGCPSILQQSEKVINYASPIPLHIHQHPPFRTEACWLLNFSSLFFILPSNNPNRSNAALAYSLLHRPHESIVSFWDSNLFFSSAKASRTWRGWRWNSISLWKNRLVRVSRWCRRLLEVVCSSFWLVGP